MAFSRVATAAALLAIGLVASGCARPADNAGSAPSAPPVSTTPAATATVPPPAVGTATASRTKGAGEITIRGIIAAGVEPGCLLLEVDSGPPYLLFGADPTVARAGARVEVVGTPVAELVSTCQQGTPLQVTSVEPL